MWRDASDHFFAAYEERFRITRPLNFEAFLKRYPPGRRELFVKTVSNQADLDLRSSAFLKREVSFAPAETFKSPRVIQGCQPVVTVMAGPSVVPATKMFKSVIHPKWCRSDFIKRRHFVYTSGYTTQEVGHAFFMAITTLQALIDTDDEVIIVEDDQNKYDVHLNEYSFDFAHELHKVTLTRKACIALKRAAKTKGSFPDGTTYTIPYTMTSGITDTAYIDTAANVAMKLFIHGEGMWYTIVCGDDSVTMMSRKHYTMLIAFDGDYLLNSYKNFGMETTIIIRKCWQDAEFCSSRFILGATTGWMVPKPGRLIAKIFCDTKCRSAKDHLKWLRSVCTTMRHYSRADPLYGALATALWPGSGDLLAESSEEQYKHKPVYDVVIPKQLIYDYYAHHYGMTNEMVDTLRIALLNSFYGQVCTHPYLALLECDC
jgi:hypothetical protein